MATDIFMYPRELQSADVSPRLAALIRELAEGLLSGPTAQHETLRKQLSTARIERVTLTGAGLYAYFTHPSGTTSVTPPDLIGGEVGMNLPELDAPAGSLIKVTDGRLDFLEIYTFGAVPWPDEPGEVEFEEAGPLPIPIQAI